MKKKPFSRDIMKKSSANTFKNLKGGREVISSYLNLIYVVYYKILSYSFLMKKPRDKMKE